MTIDGISANFEGLSNLVRALPGQKVLFDFLALGVLAYRALCLVPTLVHLGRWRVLLLFVSGFCHICVSHLSYVFYVTVKTNGFLLRALAAATFPPDVWFK